MVEKPKIFNHIEIIIKQATFLLLAKSQDKRDQQEQLHTTKIKEIFLTVQILVDIQIITHSRSLM